MASHQGTTKELLQAIVTGNVESVRRICCSSDGAKVVNAADGATPLLLSVSVARVQVGIVRILLDSGADVNARNSKGESVSELADRNGDSEVKAEVKLNREVTDLQIREDELILRLSDPAQANETAEMKSFWLLSVAERGLHSFVRQLVKDGADVNYKRNELSPVMAASQHGYHLVVKELIGVGCNVNIQRGFRRAGFNGATPLLVSASNGHFEVAELLVEAGADVDLCDNFGHSPVYMAAGNGRVRVLELLIDAKADINKAKVSGLTPLHVASEKGLDDVVQLLISAGARVNTMSLRGNSPLGIATLNRHFRVIELLREAGASDVGLVFSEQIDYKQAADLVEPWCKFLEFIDAEADQVDCLLLSARFSHPIIMELCRLTEQLKTARFQAAQTLSDADLSLKLHSAMLNSGFRQSRASLQSSAADVLQRLIRMVFRRSQQVVAGSFSEGWGNSLVQLNGKTDLDSDIDVTDFFLGRIFHLKGRCRCQNADPDTLVEYENGHVKWNGLASHPSLPSYGSWLKPAVDHVKVFPCCCYPEIEVLKAGHETRMSRSLRKSLQHRLKTSQCYLATASLPGKSGEFLRVSTNFLEKQIMRSLNDLQGQLFIVLKYLIKKEISKEVTGLKSYHAKTLLFYMIDETPADDWQQPCNLMKLTRQALQRLLIRLKDKQSEVNECMRHFFLRDAIVYLKIGTDDVEKKRKIVQVVSDTMEKLPDLLNQFRKTLKPLDESRTFQFHPFLLILGFGYSLKPFTPSNGEKICYYEIQQVVMQTVDLFSSTSSCELQELLANIEMLPDCAKTARETLRAMAYLKFGDRCAATDVLKSIVNHSVSRGIEFRDNQTVEEATEDTVWRHLNSTDSAWKFCMVGNQKPEFLLPLLFQAPKTFEFTLKSVKDEQNHVINFDCLRKCLYTELTGDTETARRWVKEATDATDTDVQEFAMALHLCEEDSQRVRLILSQSRTACQSPTNRERLIRLLSNRSPLVIICLFVAKLLTTINALQGRISNAESELT